MIMGLLYEPWTTEIESVYPNAIAIKSMPISLHLGKTLFLLNQSINYLLFDIN